MRALLCSALFAAAIAAPLAHAGDLLDLAVVDRDTGQTLPTWASQGRLHVAGTPGHRYAVRLSNRSGGRVLAVLSVDGVNAVTGQTASPEQSGYVLGPWESTEIAGWRKNLDEIAQFNFTAWPDSYAARTGRPDDVGVIGVAVFAERVPMRPRPRPKIARETMPPPATAPSDAARSAEAPAAMRAQPAPQASESMAPSAERLGTGHGDREYARVDQTTFVRATRQPAETVAIWYDSERNLVAQGVIPRPLVRQETPHPFPGGFVPDPR